MGATGDSIASQIDKLFQSDKVFDQFIIFVGANDYCSIGETSIDQFGKYLNQGLQRIRFKFPNAKVLVVDLPPVNKMANATHEDGRSVDNTPIDYRHFYARGGIVTAIAHLGVLPQTCAAYRQSECPYLSVDQNVEDTVA